MTNKKDVVNAQKLEIKRLRAVNRQLKEEIQELKELIKELT